MSNVYVEKEFRKHLKNAMAHETERLRRASHQRNVAAIVDFASNLMSLVGHGKGVRGLPVTNSFPQYQKAYSNALQRYNNSMKDYKGIIAGNIFRNRLAANKNIAKAQPRQASGSIRSGLSLRSGELENTILKNSKILKDKNYVFSK